MKKTQNSPQKMLFLAAKEIFLVSLYVTIIFSVAGFGYLAYFYLQTTLGQRLFARDIPETSILYDRTGEHILYEFHGEEDRKIISHEKIPDIVRRATIAAEDDSFYSHHGVDFFSILRALKTNLASHAIQQGGSTITQQLARNAFLTREKTYRRKILETVLAIKIENKYTKEEILDAYLNEVPYGSNAYGIEAAAQTFFQKSALDLSLDEAALLAALPKATAFYSPYGENKAELASQQKNILNRMAELSLVNPEESANAKKIDTLAKIAPATEKIEAPHFVFYVREELEKKFGQKVLYEGGLKIFTTLDFEKQKMAERIVKEQTAYNLNRYGASNAALVALNPQNGQVLAMVGSRDYFDASIDGEVNVATRPRQPGSSFKPFAYAKAFEMGYQPETLILDAQTNFGPDGSGTPYIPHNYDGKFHGIVTMRQALSMSLNIPAVKTLQTVGIDETIELAHRLGITTLNDRGRYGLSLVIGGGEVKLLDETAGFSVFANDGKRNPVDPILKIVDAKGKILHANVAQNLPALEPDVARKINSILSDNAARTPVFGPNNKLHIPGMIVAAKTGTTQEFRDAWTVGYTPSLAVGVWSGNNDNRPMRAGADGSYVAAPIWNKFMVEATAGRVNENFVAYEKSQSAPRVAGAETFRVTFYDKKKGKKISAEKARKKDPEKIEIRIESVSPSGQHNLTSTIEGTDGFDQLSLDWDKYFKND
jgi:1A family penicillin-binding protein